MIDVIRVPKNTLPRVDCIWAFLSVDEDGNESVCAAPMLGPGSLVPLIAADKAMLDSLWPIARELARVTGRIIRLVKFSEREVLSQFGGQ
jgi:hypothetical protein